MSKTRKRSKPTKKSVRTQRGGIGPATKIFLASAVLLSNAVYALSLAGVRLPGVEEAVKTLTSAPTEKMLKEAEASRRKAIEDLPEDPELRRKATIDILKGERDALTKQVLR